MSRTNEAGERAASALDQAREKANEVGGRVSDAAHRAKDAATEQYEHIKGKANEYYEQGRDKAIAYEESLESYVRDQPVKAVLIAAGVGFLLGAIWKRL